MSRQDLPNYTAHQDQSMEDHLIYCKHLTKNKKSFCFGKSPYGVIVDDIEAINIDRKIDFDFAEFISKKYKI